MGMKRLANLIRPIAAAVIPSIIIESSIILDLIQQNARLISRPLFGYHSVIVLPMYTRGMSFSTLIHYIKSFLLSNLDMG